MTIPMDWTNASLAPRGPPWSVATAQAWPCAISIHPPAWRIYPRIGPSAAGSRAVPDPCDHQPPLVPIAMPGIAAPGGALASAASKAAR